MAPEIPRKVHLEAQAQVEVQTEREGHSCSVKQSPVSEQHAKRQWQWSPQTCSSRIACESRDPGSIAVNISKPEVVGWESLDICLWYGQIVERKSGARCIVSSSALVVDSQHVALVSGRAPSSGGEIHFSVRKVSYSSGYEPLQRVRHVLPPLVPMKMVP